MVVIYNGLCGRSKVFDIDTLLSENGHSVGRLTVAGTDIGPLAERGRAVREPSLHESANRQIDFTRLRAILGFVGTSPASVLYSLGQPLWLPAFRWIPFVPLCPRVS